MTSKPAIASFRSSPTYIFKAYQTTKHKSINKKASSKRRTVGTRLTRGSKEGVERLRIVWHT